MKCSVLLIFLVGIASGCSENGGKRGNAPSDAKTVKIGTIGSVKIVTDDDKVTDVTVEMPIEASGAAPYVVHSISRPYRLHTDGAIVEGDMLLEVIPLPEFRERYPSLVDQNPKLRSAPGFCSLTQNPNGTYDCNTGSCTGTCTLHNIPVYCSCD